MSDKNVEQWPPPAQLLLNLYVHDIPQTTSRQIEYPDNILISTQNANLKVTLSEDIETLSGYFKKWWLRMPNKDYADFV